MDGQGLVLPTDQGSVPGICTKKSPHPPHIQSTVGLISSHWSLHVCGSLILTGYGHCVRGGGLEGFLGLCEKVLLSFVKMPWGGLSLTDQFFVFEAS